MIRDLLDTVGVEYHSSRSQQGEIALCCPFCEERGESADHRFRLGINTERGVGHCYNCDWASSGYARTLRELCRAYGIKRRLAVTKIAKKIVKEKAPEVTGLPPGYESFTMSKERFERAAKRYLHSRGITERQVRRHRIGYAEAGPYAGRVIFPVFGRDGMVYGAVTRAIRDDVESKYLNTPGIKILWNGFRKAHTAVVVEGVMDALAVERAIPAEASMVAVARLGSAITRRQLKQLSKYEEIVIMPDWDQAGVKGAVALATMLLEVGKQAKICIPRVMDDSDPGSKQPDEINTAISMSTPWSRNTARRLRIAASRFA